jgi:glycosyltransferase involved in cell wall biosynthesis
MRHDLVSVILPTYNRGYCIERSIDSVLGQTHERMDLIIVDDGSTDDTRERIAKRYHRDGRLRYFYQENQGVSVARNRGLREALGLFVALQDSDDVWKPWKLELQVACLESVPDAGMIWTDMEAVGSDGHLVDRSYLRKYYGAYRWFSTEQLFKESHELPLISSAIPPQVRRPRLYVGDLFSPMIMGNLVHTPTVLIRRERLEQVGGFNVDLRKAGGDYDFHLRTCRKGPVAYLDVAAIEYRAGASDQLTHPSSALQRAHNFLNTISPFIERERDRIDLSQEMIDAVLAEAHQWIGTSALSVGQRAEARRHLAQSLLCQPRQPRAALQLLAAVLPAEVERPLRRAFRSVKRRVRALRQPRAWHHCTSAAMAVLRGPSDRT